MPQAPSTPLPSHSSPGAILRLIRSGAASSRAEVARLVGISASTATTRVDELIRLGYLREAGAGASQGGRRPQLVEISPASGVVGAADLGTNHASFGLFDMGGTLLEERHLDMTIADGPRPILAWVLEQMEQMAGDQAIRGIALALPGPVDSLSGLLVSPSRMPGWNGMDVAAIMRELADVPVLVDNDANLMTLGEHGLPTSDVQHLVFVKAGSSIGCGVIASGKLHHGSHGMAGDISHVSVPDAPHVLCGCGRYDCLDVLAGGAAIVTNLRAAGVEVEDTAHVLRLAHDAHPLATRMLREAGTRTGNVLATIVNFFNPEQLVLGGNLSQAEAFVAGVRSAIYTQCLPMATDHLEIVVSHAGKLGGVRGAARLILDHLFDSDVVDQLIRAR
ncbi:MAG: transcriptional regulator [Microbacteriaceae bacterium]|jgi:predicted NBD/HSP70 family sugar kinase|nr:transcriptional regulator [Microbacteriaceae bacterium]